MHARIGKRRRFAVAAGIALALIAIGVAAQPREPFSLTISPARLVISPEKRSTQLITATNTGTEPLHVEVTTTEFVQLPNGQIVFESGGPLAATSWVEVTPTSFDLSVDEEHAVEVTIEVPENPEPGERQVAVLFTVPAEDTEGNISLNRSIGSELLIAVPGEIIHEDAIGPLAAPGFADGGPVSLSLTVENLGNVHRDYIEPDNLVATTSQGHTIEFPSFTVLRQSHRVIETSWLDPPLFCICDVTVASDDGRGNEIAASARVIVFPLRLVLGTLLVAIGLFVLTRGGIRRQRARVERRVEEARREAYEQARADVTAPAGPASGPSGQRPPTQD